MSDRLAVMREGRVLQVGTPREIYNHPAERFVADFIGDTNFLSAEVVATEGRRARLRLASGREMGADVPEGMRPEGHVTIAVRPEHAELTDDGVLAGTLENVVYIGPDTHYHVRLEDGAAFVVRTQNLRDAVETHAPGEAVGVAFKRDAVQVLKD